VENGAQNLAAEQPARKDSAAAGTLLATRSR
jgi:hypothetical protein